MKRSIFRLFTVIFAVCMLASALPLSAFAGQFPDVQDGAWYAQAAEWCYKNDLMHGFADGSFSPSSPLTRAQLTVILTKRGYADTSSASGLSFFTDVPADAWYNDAVQWAVDNEIVYGVGNGRFDPDGEVTREQLVTFMFSFTDALEYNVPGQTEREPLDVSQRKDISGYADAAEVSDWAKEAMEWAVAVGFISGTSANTLSPKAVATRAQIAVMLQKYSAAYEYDFSMLGGNKTSGGEQN